jgi:MFS family permease
MKNKNANVNFWFLVWGLGIAGQLCWNMENQWFNTFVYAKIAKDPTIISWMVGVSATATTISTFLFGCISDRLGKRKTMIAVGYILWGIFTIAFGLTQYITSGNIGTSGKLLMVAGIAVVGADAIMSFFGSMGNDIGFNAWINDHMNDKNRGQLGAALATQPIIGTIVGTVLGGMLVGSDDNYMRLFIVMGVAVICFGIYCLFAMKESPTLKPSKRGSFSHQFFSILNFKNYIKNTELAWVNLALAVYFIAFNTYFAHIGNYMIYYLGFSADTMGYIEGIALLLAMLFTIPCTKLLNNNKAPQLCIASTIINCIGVAIAGIFVRPENVNTNTIFNPVLLIGVFLLGLGYVLFLQSITVWSKQLYPEDARGQFEGIRILFNVLIPMIVAPLISNPIIKKSGEFVDENGFTEYLPTHTLLLVGAGLVLLTIIPLIFAKKYHNKRISQTPATTK